MPTPVKYNSVTLRQYNGNAIDWDADTIKFALVTSSYTPAADTHVFWSEVDDYEVTGTGYTAGGEAVANITVTKSTTTVTIDGDDVEWTQDSGGFTNARYGILYKDTGTAATSPLIEYVDLGGNVGNVSGALRLEFTSNGVLRVI